MRKPKPLPPVVLPDRLCRLCRKPLLNADFAGLGWTCIEDGCEGGTLQDPNARPEAPKKKRVRGS